MADRITDDERRLDRRDLTVMKMRAKAGRGSFATYKDHALANDVDRLIAEVERQVAELREARAEVERLTAEHPQGWQPSFIAPATASELPAGDGPCQDCGGPNVVWWADNSTWNFIMGGPGRRDDPGGIVCPTCFGRRWAAVRGGAQ